MPALEKLDAIYDSIASLPSTASILDIPNEATLLGLADSLIADLEGDGRYRDDIKNLADGINGACRSIYRGSPENNVPYHLQIIRTQCEMLRPYLI